jgi:hypothetical protein
MKKILITLMLLSVCLWGTSYAITLTDNNSTAIITPNSQSGMSNWTVDGINQLYQQWFWYRIGSTGPESSLNTIFTSSNLIAPDHLDLNFTGTGFTITIDYTLNGGAPNTGASDMAETITINNTGSAALDMHFFQYSDFDLNGTPGGDHGVFIFPFVMQQTDNNGVLVSESLTSAISNPFPSHWEISLWPNLLNSLNDGTATTLSDSTNGLSGDVVWGFEWDRTIAANGTFQISKDKNLTATAVPEPISLILLGSGLAGAGLYRRLRKPKG